MDNELVIKVKYGDTLRRFTVLSDGKGSLDLDMAGLRAKILNLFKLTPDSDITLTYVDEDSDIVTIVDDADLHDAVKQDLDPLRINVCVDSDNAGSERSTPLTSFPTTRPPYYPRVRPPRGPIMRPPHFNHMSLPPPLAVQPFSPMAPPFSYLRQNSHDMSSKASSSNEEIPKQEQVLSKLLDDLASKVAAAAPDKYRDFISKFSHDVMTSAAAAASSTAPLMCELVETLSKMGTTNNECKNPSNQNDDLNKPQDCKSSGNLKESEILSNDKNDEIAGNMTRSVSTSNTQVVASGVDVSLDSKNSAVLQGTGTSSLVCPKSVNRPHLENNCFPNENRVGSCDSFLPSPSTAYPLQGRVQLKNDSVGGQMGPNCPNSAYSTAAPPVAPQYIDAVTGHRGSSMAPRASVHVVRHGNSDNMGRIFHQGVVCDGCGVHPITGPRYKSKVKDDYDLCSICFVELGNEADYTKMERPMSYRASRVLKCHARIPHVERRIPHVERQFIQQQNQFLRDRGIFTSHRPKLDSRFIEDVNIVDGTLMAPSTRFTKIWRMHNNGAVTWPLGTQLTWIGGDQLTDTESFKLELPAQGCQVGMYLNVAIDFTAPESPGQYVSYWRMELPSGQKFGQCVWVLIQVETTQRDSLSGSCRNLNLNLPPDSLDSKDEEQIIDINAEPIDASNPDLSSDMASESVKPLIDGFTSKEMESASHNSSSTLSLVPTPEAYSEIPVVPSAPISAYPDFPVTSSAPVPVTDVQITSGVVSNENAIEQSLLMELAEMGFKEIDLNKEVLRVNDYDLDKALDDLCDVAEWDPMLEELKEMGFCDKETNRKLLIKNGGSIKRVVLDLINAEKEKQL